MSNYDPAPTLALTTEDQVRAYVNPTRLTILAFLAEEQQSVSMVARRLGVHPANLTHHFKILEKAALIRLVEKRETGKNLEKFYRAVAYHFTVELDQQAADPRLTALAILRDNLDAALRYLRAEPADQPVLGLLKTVRIPEEALDAFQRRLVTLADEFAGQSAATGLVYTFNASLYPAQAAGHASQEITLTPAE